jgi:hypothetical protein
VKGSNLGKIELTRKHEVFGHVVQTPESVSPVGYKWIFVRKCNEKK